MTLSAIDRFFAHPAALPALPEIARHLLATFARDDVSLGELDALIGQDPALATRLLRLANSARYQARSRVTRLRDAAARVGLGALRGLALSACLVDAFPNPPGFDRRRFWGQSLATSSHARTLAGVLDLDRDTAEVAGLVLRAGQLLMLMTEPGTVALVESLSAAPDSVFELERQHFGCSHAEVTAELAVRWRLPTALVDTIYTAGDPLAAQPFAPPGAALRLASVLADAGHDGLDPVAALAQAQPLLLERLRLDPQCLVEMIEPQVRIAAALGELLP